MHRDQGMTFIEVLVALVILATGILGAVAMQTVAKKSSFDAMQRSVASALAQDIIERMRVNEARALFLENYQGTWGAGSLSAPSNICRTLGSPCTPGQIVRSDLYQWEQKLLGADTKQGANNTGSLVNARGCIDHDANLVTVVVSWEGRTEIADIAAGAPDVAKNCGSGSKKRRQVVVQAVIF